MRTDLPGFVQAFGYRGFKWRLRGTVRMETPVMYFYSPREVEAHVKVAFPQGLITECIPRPTNEVYQTRGKNGVPSRLEPNLNGIDTSLRSVTGAIEWKPHQGPAERRARAAARERPEPLLRRPRNRRAPIAVGDQHEKFLVLSRRRAFRRSTLRSGVPGRRSSSRTMVTTPCRA